MRKVIQAVLVALLLLASGSAAYYWNEVREARADTRALVDRAFQRFGRRASLEDLPPDRLETLLKIEDPAFWRHRGVDLATPGAGMTTITQGLAKLLYFPDGFRQGVAKIRQTLIAEYALDALIAKEEQLALYLNATYFGTVEERPVHGLAAAAETYFAKPHTALSEDEFIALIGMTISPNTLKPGSAASAARVARIKSYLAGETTPASVLDFDYVGKESGSFAEEALMAFLRLITDADPGAQEAASPPARPAAATG